MKTHHAAQPLSPIFLFLFRWCFSAFHTPCCALLAEPVLSSQWVSLCPFSAAICFCLCLCRLSLLLHPLFSPSVFFFCHLWVSSLPSLSLLNIFGVFLYLFITDRFLCQLLFVIHVLSVVFLIAAYSNFTLSFSIISHFTIALRLQQMS